MTVGSVHNLSRMAVAVCAITIFSTMSVAQTAGEGSGAGTVGSGGMTTEQGSAAQENGPPGAAQDTAKQNADQHRTSGSRSPSTNTE